MGKTLFFSLFLLIFGFALMFFSRNFAEYAVRSQNWLWGFHFGEKEVKNTQKIAFVCGLIFSLLSVFTLIGVVRFKPLENQNMKDFLGLALVIIGWSLLHFRQQIFSGIEKVFKFKQSQRLLKVLVVATGCGFILVGLWIFGKPLLKEFLSILSFLGLVTIVLGGVLIRFRLNIISSARKIFRFNRFQKLLEFLLVVIGCVTILIGIWIFSGVIK
jgi:hypothetical protein